MLGDTARSPGPGAAPGGVASCGGPWALPAPIQPLAFQPHSEVTGSGWTTAADLGVLGAGQAAWAAVGATLGTAELLGTGRGREEQC